MPIALWSELLSYNSTLSKQARTYSAHSLSPYSQMLKKFSTAVHFSIKLPLFLHLLPAHFHIDITSLNLGYGIAHSLKDLNI